MVDDIINQQILPNYAQLTSNTQQLAQVSQQTCAIDSAPLLAAYGTAFDAWLGVSHLRFGPSETDNRAFALAFWPDSRNKIPKAVTTLIRNEDAIVDTADSFTSASIAARGFYALDFLLFNPDLAGADIAAYRCKLIQAITTDIATTAQAIETDWVENYAPQMLNPGDRYQTESEVKQELFKALNTGLQLTGDMRLGRPLGTYDRPRPHRAEAYRSGRSLHHITLSLQVLEPLAIALSGDNTELADKFRAGFAKTVKTSNRLNDPTLAGVADPASRFRIESLQQQVTDLRTLADTELGPSLGVDAGFNSLDGD